MIDDSMDAKEYCYPCKYCEKKAFCHNRECATWLEWFGAKWREVTEVLKKGKKES